jgi:AAA domain
VIEAVPDPDDAMPERLVDLARPRPKTDGQGPKVDRWQDGASFILDAPKTVPAIWGDPDSGEVLWTPGEVLKLAGAEGLGKGTLAQQLDRRAGIIEGPLLGFPVAVGAGRVAYIAADRPNQIRRSWARMGSESEREARRLGLTVWWGPLPFDLGREPDRLLPFLARRGEIDTVILDSLGAVATDLASDEAGSRVAWALGSVIAAGIEVVTVYHPRKAAPGATMQLRSLDDVYGSRWITAACGSVIAINGEAPGDVIVEFRHLKPPAAEVGPLTLRHEHERGLTFVHHEADLVEAATDGITAKDAAALVFSTTKPTRNEIEKARRKLDRLVSKKLLDRDDGDRQTPSVYRRAP